MSVRQLLRSMDSAEISEWQAYERAFGPLDRAYGDDMLARIHEQLQMLTHVQGASGAGKDNPVPAPKRVPRPPDVFAPDADAPDPDDESDSEEPEQEPTLTWQQAVPIFEQRQQLQSM